MIALPSPLESRSVSAAGFQPLRAFKLDRLAEEVISLIDPGGVPTAHLKIKCLRAVLDSMPDNISIKDLQGRYIFDNSSHCRFLGATNTVEVVGKTVFDSPQLESQQSFMPKIFTYCAQRSRGSVCRRDR